MQITSLIPRLLAGEDQAIQELIDASLSSLCAIAGSSGASPEDAEEIAIDAIRNTLRLLPTLSFEDSQSKDPLFSYLAQATRRGVYAYHRERQHEEKVVGKIIDVTAVQRVFSDDEEIKGKPLWLSDPVSSPEVPTEDIDLLRALMNTLVDKDRQIVELRGHTTLTWEEIAEEVGLTTANVRKKWERIRRKFGDQWEMQKRKGTGNVSR